MRIKLEDLPDEYRKQIEKKIANEDRTSISSSNKQSNHKHPTKENVQEYKIRSGSVLKTKKSSVPAYIQCPVEIRIQIYRLRLSDSEGCFIKPAIDGLVKAGILQDDGPNWIPQRPDEKQYKVGSYQEERTVIEIYELCQ